MKLAQIALCAVLAGSAAASEGEWPTYRLNPAQDARATIKGHITAPAIVWKKFIGLTEQQYVLEPAAGQAWEPVGSAAWGLTPQVAEIGGQQAPLESNVTTTYAEVLPEVPGLEKLEFESGFNKPQVDGQWESSIGRCFAWRNGQWETVWASEPISLCFQPLPIAGDFDGDGALDVAVLPWNELLLLDAKTGAVKDRCTFTEGRSYGALHAVDLEGDGRSEFVVLADFSKHVDVLGFREGKLVLLWRREVELGFDSPQKMLRAHPRAVAHVFGDAPQEVVVSIFNEAGDRKWHVLVLDGLTGAVLADLPEEILQGLVDTNGDGMAELFTAGTHDINVPDYTHLRLRSLAEGSPVLWEQTEAAWELGAPPVPLTVNTAATKGREDVLLRQGQTETYCVVRTRDDAGAHLAVLSFGPEGVRQIAAAAGPGARALALDLHGNLHLRTAGPSVEAAAATAHNGVLSPHLTANLGLPGPTMPIVLHTQDQLPTVVVPGPEDQIVVLRAQAEGEPVELTRFPGRGQGYDWPNGYGVTGVDLAGNGSRSIIAAGAAPEGHGRLRAIDLTGRELWHHDFPSIPGTPPVWNTGGILFWQAAHFTSPTEQDILVQVRRSVMHTEETHLLSGKDGAVLWSRTDQVSSRAVGGTPFAIADFDGDGLDDAASFHPSILYILKGTDGSDIIAQDALWELVPQKPVYWGLPTAGDFEHTGKPTLFLHAARGGVNGLVRPDASLAWWAGIADSWIGQAAFGRFSGGESQAVTIAGKNLLRCYDTATGAVEWDLPMPELYSCVGVCSGDIDFDGKDEALFIFGSTLYCAGTDAAGKGLLKWQFLLPGNAGPPIIADVQGDGLASILVAGVDGYLYCIR